MSDSAPANTPTATYRLQLQPGFGFTEAAGVVGYLARLGVSHVYCSPILEAGPGSAHGYDVVDHRRLRAELGGEDGWKRLVAAVRQHGLGLVVDIVPNHMSVDAPESLNHAWWSLLRSGPDSPYARWFDVDWQAHGGRVLVPVLGAPVGSSLDDLVVERGEHGDVLRYHDHELPLAAGTANLPLPQLLEAQHYRLAYWRVGIDEVNYRRFFDLTALAGLRSEDPAVFEATHERILELVHAGEIDGLRIDHPDGLADPGGYLQRLAEAAAPARPWVVVEKILEPGERLPSGWACSGTTGYDAAHQVGGLLLDPAGKRPLTDLYLSLTGAPASWNEVVEDSERLIVTESLVAEVDRLTDAIVEACSGELALRDHTRRALREAAVELLVAFPVYRGYAVPGAETDSGTVEVTERAAALATSRLHRRVREIELIRDLVLGRHDDGGSRGEVAVRFQQTCAAVTAKGVEDTACYRWFRLASLNEVGGDPDTWGVSVSDFHAYCTRMQATWPAAMTALTTHDTNRAEDVRARLAVLSELPGAWGEAVTGWRATAGRGPDRNTEYLFWQTLVGAWPISAERMLDYLGKAVREAKRHTSWTERDPGYEAAVRDYVSRVYDDNDLLDRVGAFVASLAYYAWCNALAQRLVQLTMPGVPDTYQGSELWDASLVDPDNRRPVDFVARAELLGRLDGSGDPAGLVEPPAGAGDTGGTAKLHVLAQALRLRRERPQWFVGPEASYEPRHAAGPAAGHVVAFSRSGRALTVASRLPARLRRSGGWGTTTIELPPGAWTDRLTGASHTGEVGLAELLARLPVALLVAE